MRPPQVKRNLRLDIFVLAEYPQSSPAAARYGFIMEVSSTVSCLLLILRTLDGPIHGGTNPQFPYLTVELFTITDLVFTALFTFDFLLRMLCCPAFWSEKVISDDARSSLTCITGRKFEPFVKCPFNWFDFASILPSYISELFGKSSVIALLRLCRMLRILKITRNFSGTYVLLKAIRESIPPIKIAVSIIYPSLVLATHNSRFCFSPSTLLFLAHSCTFWIRAMIKQPVVSRMHSMERISY